MSVLPILILACGSVCDLFLIFWVYLPIFSCEVDLEGVIPVLAKAQVLTLVGSLGNNTLGMFPYYNMKQCTYICINPLNEWLICMGIWYPNQYFLHKNSYFVKSIYHLSPSLLLISYF